MKPIFRRVALIGKYQRPATGPAASGSREIIDCIARFVIAQEMGGPRDGGVQVAGIAYGSPEGRLVYDPTHPLADDGGYVRLPDIDLGSQMSKLIIAQRISTILHADQIVVLKDGEIVGLGTHDELMETCEVYRAIAESQMKGGE